jgi:hypothetical protein
VVVAQSFLGGDAPLYPDYIAFGAFQWSRAISSFVLLEASDPINQSLAECWTCTAGLHERRPATVTRAHVARMRYLPSRDALSSAGMRWS